MVQFECPKYQNRSWVSSAFQEFPFPFGALALWGNKKWLAGSLIRNCTNCGFKLAWQAAKCSSLNGPTTETTFHSPVSFSYSSIYFIGHPRCSSPFASFLLSRACLQCSSITLSFWSRIEDGRGRVPVSVNIKPRTTKTESLKLGKD